ncbi:MAG: hypothetical protein B1H02_02345 [Candidatus Latescibacteria bacterium 4484_107]|nr:MAG: hypothetical protein B1H02_02345 [Candidatus Latescibacteria bacterium 4484_107]
MKIALSIGTSDEAVRFVKQLGLRHVVSGLSGTPSGILDFSSLMRTRTFFEAAGLTWDVIENLPTTHYDKVMFGLPGRDEQIANVCTSIRNMGRAGIGVLQYQWMLLGGLRTEYSPTGRGGARYSRFDLEVSQRMPAASMDWLGDGPYPHLPDRKLSAEEVWDNLVYFLERIVPVAEEAGVKLAIHPDDAPIPSFMGVARIMTSLEALQRVIDAVPSPCNGLGFCQGTIATMAGVDAVAAIRRFGGQGKIFFAHFRNPRGQVPKFDEVFPDEGDTDMFEAVRAYREVAFDGVMRIDHCPGVIGDNDRSHRSFAYQVGYTKGLMQAVEAMDDSTTAKGENGLQPALTVNKTAKEPPDYPADGENGLQLALTVSWQQDRDMIFAQQLGVNRIVAEVDRWDAETLSSVRNRVEQAGLKLAAIEKLPQSLYEKAILGLPGRDEELERVCQAIRNMGVAGIPLVSYRWTSPWDRQSEVVFRGRGDAVVSGYDEARPPRTSSSVEQKVTAEAVWDNLTYFLERVIPVAEKAGVKLAIHPDDPPVPSLGGVARIFHDVASLIRLFERVPSPYHGLDLCVGTLATMPGADVIETIREFGANKRIFMVHLRNPRGTMPSFRDGFLDEGDVDMLEALRALQSVGFAGPIRAACPPEMVGDTVWGHKARALDVGYLRALLESVERDGF